jgi:hypothetical protein
MKRRLLLILGLSLIVINFGGSSTAAQIEQNCEQNQEIFKFQMTTYPIKHQGGAILNINVAYRFTQEAIAENKYPDFIPIKNEIDAFLRNYPDEWDFWEIVNKKLVQSILEKYPQMASLQIAINVMPTVQETDRRGSIVKNTRPGSCPLIFSE